MDTHVLAAAQTDGQYLRRLAHQRLAICLQVSQLRKHLGDSDAACGGVNKSAKKQGQGNSPQYAGHGRAATQSSTFSISGTVRVQ
jgi:hypothetical protein